MIQNGYTAVSQTELWSWLKDFEPDADKGFMFTRHENLDRITETMDSLPDSPGHSGSSFSITMRHLHFIAKNGLEKYKIEITKNR
jgi:hypothetical protein